MWNGKKKAFTFSFDDGVKQDIRAIEILNKYGLKATFNLNSGFLGLPDERPLQPNGRRDVRDKVEAHKVKDIYIGHEVAVHTLTHPNLTKLSEQTVIRQIEEDRKALETLVGYEIYGMAYPCGGVNNDERVAEIIRKNTPIRYARTIASTGNFDLQKNLLQFHPTVYWRERDRCFELAEKFLKMQSDKPQLFFIWGHTYEFDLFENDWDVFEDFCKRMAGKENIFYGTNSEILL